MFASAASNLISQFTGKERDAETGLDFFLARYYSGAQGRFLSVDPENAGAKPEDPQSWNAYAYSRNNPLLYTDPDGRRYCLSNNQGYSGEIENWRFYDVYWKKSGYAFAKGSTISGGSFTDKDGVIWHYQYFRSEHDADDIKNKNDGIELHFAANFAIGALFKSAIFGFADLLEANIAAEGGRLGEFSGILRDAASGKGNFGIGSATEAEAEALGKAWVGPGARAASDGKSLVSADGLRIYRPPSFKPNLGKVQANFETKVVSGGRPISNGHLDIK
jgi:RHS repeat-associated protein